MVIMVIHFGTWTRGMNLKKSKYYSRVFPSLLLLHPEDALSCLMYRYNRLDTALNKATSNNYSGAMFPWESAYSGIVFFYFISCWFLF